MRICEAYFLPKTLGEATALLKEHQGDARIIAGGTDLVIDLKTKRKKARSLVDLSKVEGLREIHFAQETVSLGAMVTHTQVSRSEPIRRGIPVLSEACSSVGSPQVRNMGTLVGNVVNAMPAADGASALVALHAVAKIVDWEKHERIVPIRDLYRGVGDSWIDSTREILREVQFSIPKPPFGSAFLRLSRRRALSLPILNAAVLVRLDPGLSIFEEVRLVIGPVAPVPFRSEKAEKILVGSETRAKVIREASLVASEESSPRSSLRAGSFYRKEMVGVLVERALCRALSRVDPKFDALLEQSIDPVTKID